MDNNRTLYFDVLRVLACVMVVAMHAPFSSTESVDHGVFLVANGYFNSPCVPLFFMVSGALLLNNNPYASASGYLKKRIGKVIYPTMCFSLFYILLNHSGYVKMGGESLLSSLISLPFMYCTPVLWFMYVLIGLYLLIPILLPWAANATKKDLHLYLGLWLVSQFYPWISLVIDVNTSVNGVLYYFSGYVGYFIFGYYLRRYDISLKWLLITSILLLPLPVLPKILYTDVDNTIFTSYLSLPPVVFTATCFILGKRYVDRIPKNILDKFSFVSKLSLAFIYGISSLDIIF